MVKVIKSCTNPQNKAGKIVTERHEGAKPGCVVYSAAKFDLKYIYPVNQFPDVTSLCVSIYM